MTASSIFGSLSRSGIDRGGDGWVTLFAGTFIVLFGIITAGTPGRAANLLIAIAAAVALVVFSIDFADVQTRISYLESGSSGLALGSVGVGLWMVALGSMVAFFGSIARRSRGRGKDRG